MARDELRLNGKTYKVHKGRHGERLWGFTERPSQHGDPGGMGVMEWRVDGPDFTSFEQIGVGQQAGYLGRDYGDLPAYLAVIFFKTLSQVVQE